MTDNLETWVQETVANYVRESPDNRFRGGFDERAFDEAVVRFASAADPIFESYKEAVGELHWTPLEIFRLTFPDAQVRAEDLTVISWVLPQKEITRDDNTAQSTYPAPRWVQARFAGEDFNNSLRRHLLAELDRMGVKAVAPVISELFSWGPSEKYVYTSKWSERHVAHAAGHGTFGLCDGLITSKGKAHRVGSVVANVAIEPSGRPYSDRHEYCLFFQDGSCMVCADRCPAQAITEAGHDKTKCWEHAGKVCADYIKENYGFEGYGCGLCQTGVPCESEIP